MNQQRFISTLKYLLLLSVGVLLLWIAFKGQDPNKLIEDLRHANYFWVGIALIVMFASHWLRALRWNMMIVSLGHRPKTINTFSAVIIGYMANLAFPRMGEVSRCGVLVKTDKIPLNSLIGTVLVERLIDLISLALILALTIVLQFNLIIDFLNTYLFNPLLVKLTDNSIALTVAVLLGAFSCFIAWWVFRQNKTRIYKSAIAVKVINLATGIKEGFVSVQRIERLWLFILYSILIWAFYFLNTYLIFSAMAPTAHLGLSAALVILTVGSFGMTAPVQGGIGAFHWMVSEGLTLYTISKADGLSFATISHSSQTLAILVVGAVCLIFVAGFNQKNEQA